MNKHCGWDGTEGGKPKYSEKNCPSDTLSTTNPTWTGMKLQGFRRKVSCLLLIK
jgi:hypothetical protein